MNATHSLSLGQMVRRFRLGAALSQEELAEQSGLSARQISDLERGLRKSPRLETIRMLSAALTLGDEARADLLAAARPELRLPGEHPSAEPRGTVFDANAVREHGIGLPIPPTPMVGRDQEVRELMSLVLDSNTRLITLTGPGGVGKTRLALEIARRAAPAFTWGAVFVDLSPVASPDSVASAITQSLGIHESSEVPLSETLRNAIAPRHMLLILDNFEQVIEAAPLAGTLLAVAPGLRVISTSREALRLRGETVVAIQPLSVPEDYESMDLPKLAAIPSIALFVDVARRGMPEFSLTPENASAVTGICQRLDGLPLAIELAATRVKLLPPPMLLKRMDQRLPLLVGGPRDLPVRQQTLRNAISWSYDLLSSDEQMLFRGLAVFTGGARLDSIEAVNAAGENLDSDLLSVLASLFEKNLVRRVDDPDGTPRFSMFDTVQEFASEKLRCSSEGDAIRWAHARHFLEFAEGYFRTYKGRVNTLGVHDRVILDFDNIRRGIDWFSAQQTSSEHARFVVAMTDYFFDRGLYRDADALCQRSLELASVHPLGDRLQGQILALRALTSVATGNQLLAESTARQSLELLQRQPADRDQASNALVMLAVALREQGRRSEALPYAEEALRISRQLNDQHLEAFMLYHVGKLEYYLDNIERAVTVLEESLALARRAGAVATGLYAIAILAIVRIREGDVSEAASLLKEAPQLWKSGGNRNEAGAFWIGYAGALAAVAGLHEPAARLFGFASTFIGYCGVLGIVHHKLGDVFANLRAQFDESDFEAAYDAGARMTLAEAVALALDVVNQAEDASRHRTGDHLLHAPNAHMLAQAS